MPRTALRRRLSIAATVGVASLMVGHAAPEGILAATGQAPAARQK